ncbi:MAG: hypothetical protein NVS9B7_28550 [Flavisolibacter sp.]
MGICEVEIESKKIIIHSHLITYGNASDALITEQIANEIEALWNEPQAQILFGGSFYLVEFKITSENLPRISELEVISNLDPRNNYIRIEAFARGNISFVDGLGSNSGYFLLENLYIDSTTAAHEYGHTLGLDHPPVLDIRGKGIPGMMYPRGTIVDSEFQYEPSKPAGTKGGTLHPRYRKVKKEEIDALHLSQLKFKNNQAILGYFTNVYHERQVDAREGFANGSPNS